MHMTSVKNNKKCDKMSVPYVCTYVSSCVHICIYTNTFITQSGKEWNLAICDSMGMWNRLDNDQYNIISLMGRIIFSH